MVQTEDFQQDTIKSLQKKTWLFLAITLVLLSFRIIVLAFISLLIILLLFRKELLKKPLLSDLKGGLFNSIWLLSFPAITGLCLFTFKQQYYLKFQFNEMLLLRWLYFVLTFIAVNKLLDINPFHKFLRKIFIILILLVTSYLQDFTSTAEGNSTIYAALSGVGVTQMFSIIAFRKTYKNSFWTGLFSAAFTGLIVCFLIFGAVSANYFTFLFPPVAILVASISMRSKGLKSGIISFGIVSLVCLLFSLFFPYVFPPEIRDIVRENKKQETKYHEQVEDIQINYNDTTVRVALRQIAEVLHAANQVSRENFGISPDLNWITIYGIEPGGFNGVYPKGIIGNFSFVWNISLSELDQNRI